MGWTVRVLFNNIFFFVKERNKKKSIYFMGFCNSTWQKQLLLTLLVSRVQTTLLFV